MKTIVALLAVLSLTACVSRTVERETVVPRTVEVVPAPAAPAAVVPVPADRPSVIVPR